LRNKSSDNDITVEFRVNAIKLARAAEILEKAEIPGFNLAQIARAIFDLAIENLPLLLKFKPQEFTSKLSAVVYLRSMGVTSAQFSGNYSKQLALSLAHESMAETSKEIDEIMEQSRSIKWTDASTDPDLSKLLDEK
jgi:hypothetical protein